MPLKYLFRNGSQPLTLTTPGDGDSLGMQFLLETAGVDVVDAPRPTLQNQLPITRQPPRHWVTLHKLFSNLELSPFSLISYFLIKC